MTRVRSLLTWITMGMLATSTAWTSETIDLTDGWRFAPDSENIGLAQGWQRPGFDDSGWAAIQAGKRWEDQGFPKVDGPAWYRRLVHLPESMRAGHIWLNLGGLNDCGIVFCNGKQVGVFGDESLVSVADSPLVADLTDCVRWDADNTIAIRVFDWGDSGGLQKTPCTLTTDCDALAVQSLLCFAPGFDGRRTVVGVEIGPLGAQEGDLVQLSLTVEGRTPMVKTVRAILDRTWRPTGVASFDLDAKPGETVLMRAEVFGDEDRTPMTLEQTYVWPAAPKWPGRYAGLKVLNNFVTELREVESIPKSQAHFSFLNPRDGWVFIQIVGETKPEAYLNNGEAPLIWRIHPETGAAEAMQYLVEGEHILQLENAQDAQLFVRAVPEIAFCFWPMGNRPAPSPMPSENLGEERIFPNTNVLITRGDATPAFFEEWRAEGRRWLRGASLPGHRDKTAPTPDSVYEAWAANDCVAVPGYSGIIVDEFVTHSIEHYAAWGEAIERLHRIPAFQGQAFYAWIGHNEVYEPELEFMRTLYDLGGRYAWEQYLHEEPTEDLALLRIHRRLNALSDWEQVIPGIRERLTICFGSFVSPVVSLNINPAVHYIPFMEAQFQVLATDPAFFGLLGAFQWAAHQADDDMLRYAQRLLRHYCIDGNRTFYGSFPYALEHLENPDFAQGLKGWSVAGQTPGSLVADTYPAFGRIQGRWASLATGDTCAATTRSDQAPNTLAQTVRNLEPGRLYTLKFIAADLNDLHAEREVGLWPTLHGVELVPEYGFRTVVPSSWAYGNPDETILALDKMAYTTHCQLGFRPKDTSAQLTFSDWRDGKPAGPIGQRIGFNFVEIQPVFEE